MKCQVILFTLLLASCSKEPEKQVTATVITAEPLHRPASVPTLAPAPKPDTLCDVVLCNKIKRFSLSPWAHIKDKIGETCFDAVLPASESVVGKNLSSNSRWYQGKTINPTKRSVTFVKSVGKCAAP